jgi:hypothetical protein
MGIFQDMERFQMQQPQNTAATPQNMMEAFGNFMQAMQGRNPDQVLSAMLNSGKLPQGALQQAQQMARQFEPMLKGFFR